MSESLWIATSDATTYRPLVEGVNVDVAIIGGGMTGLSAATLLKANGMRVAVVEGDRIGHGVTGHTTGKITSQHGLTYAELIDTFGEEGARTYALANEGAIALVAAVVDAFGLDCDFEKAPAFVYSEDASQRAAIEAEVEAAQRLGLPALFTTDTELPFPVAAAIRFDGQAQVHARKYLLGLARFVDGDGSHVFESTRAVDVDEASTCVVHTDNGDLLASHVILATHLPFLDRGGFFAKAHPSRSYLIAARTALPAPRGMYLAAGSGRTIRSYRGAQGEFVLVGGEGHKTGEGGDEAERYERLERWARDRYGATEVAYKWSAQDYMPVDAVPYIGALTPLSRRVWVATGYRKWGLTNATVAAMLLTDRILGRDNAWAPFFDAQRLNLAASARSFVSANLDVVRRFLGDRVAGGARLNPASLRAGEGAVVEIEGDKYAVARDEAGALHALSPVCQHLGCLVHWNEADRTWDCPCHGSRYDIRGAVIHGPAVTGLEPRALPQE